MTEPVEGSPPMTPVAAQPVEAAEAKAAAYADALAQLPPEAVADVLAQLDATVTEAQRDGDLTVVRHLLDSLLMTARLGRNEAYLRAVAEADAAEAAGTEEPEDVGEFVARMRAKHQG